MNNPQICFEKDKKYALRNQKLKFCPRQHVFLDLDTYLCLFRRKSDDKIYNFLNLILSKLDPIINEKFFYKPDIMLGQSCILT